LLVEEEGFRKSMRVVVALEDRFLKVGENFYSHNLGYESFWKRYTKVFDSLVIICRVTVGESVPKGWEIVNREGVEVAALPEYRGPYEYLKQRHNIHRIIHETLHMDDTIILRVSGNISNKVWQQLPAGYPFGVEVVADPWNSLARGNVRYIGRPFFRWQFTRILKNQCQQASAASYVTEHALQQRYPANKNAYTTHYSSIDLNSEGLKDDVSQRLAVISTIPERLVGNGPPVRLGFIGSFSQIHKLPHVHIKAIAQCIAKGANLEFEMIGDGKYLNNMKMLAKRLGVEGRVTFRGALPAGKHIFDAIDTFDLFLNATAAEGLSRVIVEAMSRGCPCIASDVGGTSELLGQNQLVPAGDVKALAEAILRVLSDPKSMAKIVERNVRIARNYCSDVLEPRRQQFYAELRRRTEKYLSSKS